MPDGDSSSSVHDPPMACTSEACAAAASIVEYSGEEEAQAEKKDPRKKARKYQLDLCKKALQENMIVYLGTGCGKTHIAVLLIHEFGNLIRKPMKNICVFLAPTIALVQQQARVIEESTDFKVGVYCESSKRFSSNHAWEKQIETNEVLVMTPQILLRNLYHCFIKMDLIALLIFDECHHAQVKSNHAYAEIMKLFYKRNETKRPRIFGMTASLVVGKDASNQTSLIQSINSLEKLLDAKVHSVEDMEELERFVASPAVKIYEYDSLTNSTSSSLKNCCTKLEDINRLYISTLRSKTDDLQYLRSTKKQLKKMHTNIMFCLENFGFWGASQACRLFLKGNHSEIDELIADEGNLSHNSECDGYLAQAADLFASYCREDGSTSDLSCLEALNEPFFSKKLLRLIQILCSFRMQQNMKCIIFVNRIITAITLSCILQNFTFLSPWSSHFLVGVHSGQMNMSRKNMKSILERFRTGELNILVATNVGEEGLDIQTCCLVIRFDLPQTVASFIQSRGRARMPHSEYAFLVNSANGKELDLINIFKRSEDQMNMEISSRTSSETFPCPQERIYKVDSTGASISSGYSISLLHHYCSKLPHDEYFDPKPKFYYFDDSKGTVCSICLPSNAPVRQIDSTAQSSIENAKKDACLKAIEELHKLGSLNDHLLPHQDDSVEEDLEVVSSDSESYRDEGRAELHEMLVPAALRGSLANLESPVLNAYYIQFFPNPVDRNYKDFGIFVKSPLPEEAERMELDLHLARRRSVMTKLVPSGVSKFDKDEILQAQHFQEICLKIFIDRSKFVPEFVPLRNNGFCNSSSSTFYLLLPVILNDLENTLTVDWMVIRRFLSSPIFKTPAEVTKNEILRSDVCLQLDNGCWRKSDIENSLVYAPEKGVFYFVTNIVDDKGNNNPYKDSGTEGIGESLTDRFHLEHPEQPLLRVKPLSCLHNLLRNRKPENTEAQKLEEYFIYLPPEHCQLKILGFSKDIGSSLSLLPSVMHRLENLLVAIELKHMLSASFPEAADVTAIKFLEALTTEKCQERFSLERLEILGDAFLKYAVGRHLFLLHDTLDEGELTRKRSNAVNNSNLFKLATRRNLQVYIRDQPLDPCQFFALGRPCPILCSKETEGKLHSQDSKLRCNRGHQWLHKKTIADVVEALVGAFIVDSGFGAASAFLRWIGIKVDFEASQVTNVCIASKCYMPLTKHIDVSAVEKCLDYQFLHKGLLLQAFVHPSYNKHGGGCYQRLEFLGDAVLDYLITSYLFSVYPKLKPGQLTDLRSMSVNNNAFANVAIERSFHKFLLSESSFLSEAIEKYVDFVTSSSSTGSFEGPKCPKALGDLVESCLGAILLDTGFNLNHVWNIMLSLLNPINSISGMQLSPIRELKEICQSNNLNLEFSATKTGANFTAEVKAFTEDDCIDASALNPSKKDAFRIAAQQLAAKLKGLGYALTSKSLEEVLKASTKQEAKLIGYSEIPIDVSVPDTTADDNLTLQEPWGNKFNPETHSTDKKTEIPSSSEATGGLPSYPASNLNRSTGSDRTGVSKTARSRLYEICADNYWKPPEFECCKEEGQSHLKLFTFKVALQITEGAEDCVLECFGTAMSRKKAAAENAAEGAVWYLERAGLLQPRSH